MTLKNKTFIVFWFGDKIGGINRFKTSADLQIIKSADRKFQLGIQLLNLVDH